MGNPINFVDPDGQEIWIYYNDDDGKEQKIRYTAGMTYDGDNSFVTNIVNNLNAVYASGGDKLLNVLIASNYTYDMKDLLSTSGSASFKRYKHKDGGGEILAKKIGAGFNAGTIEGTAHELMHGAQHEFGQGGRSIFNEVEAYVFGNCVALRFNSNAWPISSMGIDGTSPVAIAWEAAFNDLVKNGYSAESMRKAVLNFKDGAQVNQSGIYSDFSLGIDPMPESLLPVLWEP